MRKANRNLTVIAGLVFLFQAGTTPALADDGGHRSSANGGDVGQVATASTGSNLPVGALGGIFMGVGAWLLRRPVRPSNT